MLRFLAAAGLLSVAADESLEALMLACLIIAALALCGAFIFDLRQHGGRPERG